MKGFVLWFTGLSGAGKSTIAENVAKELKSYDIAFELLDGDEVRENLTKDLGFTREDRDENIKRIGFVAKLLSRNGVGVITAFISPYENMRQYVRENSTNFIEVYINAPLEECERRDVKGLYKKARDGEINLFTGVSDPYEPPKNPEIELRTDQETPEESVAKVIEYLKKGDFI
ncbi:MAG: adenylyl-sulfate kinase [Nanobdellota archaeon]